MTADKSIPACRGCGRPAERGILLLLDEKGAVCPYCRSLELAVRTEVAEISGSNEPFFMEDLGSLRSLCRSIQESTDALEVFLFSSDGHPLGYSSERLSPYDLTDMGDLISSVISSYKSIFNILGGDHGFILVGEEECHCLVRSIPPRLVMAVIVDPEYPLDELKLMLKPFIGELERFQKNSAGG